MRVLFQSREGLFTSPGGDTVQILKTKEYLERLGVKVDISLELEPNLKDYNIIHLFNLTTPEEIYPQLMNAKNQNKKVALSTIYVIYTEFERKARGGIAQIIFNLLSPYTIQYLKSLIKTLKYRNFNKGRMYILTRGYYNILKEITKNVDLFLPNSEGEMDNVKRDFNLKTPNYITIPNAVDHELFDYEKTIVNEAKQYEGCVLCVGRIEGRKSQLNVVRAMKGLPFKLVIIGKPAPNQMKYYNKVKKESGDNVVFIEQLSHEKLNQYYKVAKVNILASWMETTGLVSLEAAVMNCNIVITKKGHTEEYFKDYAFYCEPDNVDSIRNAILNAYNSPFNENFKSYILNNFIWEKTAENTFKGYKSILNTGNY